MRNMLAAAAALGAVATSLTAPAVPLAAASAITAAAAPASLPSARILDYLHARGEALHLTQPSPVRAVYCDWRDVSWSAPQQTVLSMADAGYNVIILAFFLSASGPTDMLQAFAGVDAATRNATIAYAHSKGAVVMLSAGGATDLPFSHDPVAFGSAAANCSVSLGLDGVDFDLENVGPNFVYPGFTGPQLVDWMVNATVAARRVLGSGPSGGLISHAPQAPYFGPIGTAGSQQNGWPGPTGGYTGVVAAMPAGTLDWLNTQFYNQGDACYVSYDSLFTQSDAGGQCTNFPGTSVAEIASYGVPLELLVVGKYLETSDASNGYVNASALHAYFQQAGTDLGWHAGVMCWSWETTDSPPWINTIYPPNATADGR